MKSNIKSTIRMNLKYVCIAVLLLLLMAGSGMAQGNVTYTCCQNFTTSEGNLIESFDNVSTFTKASGNISISQDTTNFIEGTGAVMATSNDSAAAGALQFQKNIAFDANTSRNFRLRIYVDNSSNLSNIYIYFFNSTSSTTNYFFLSVTPESSLVTGWNNIVWQKSDMAITGTGNASIQKIKIRVNSKALNTVVNVTFDDLRINRTGRAKALITFDDGKDTIYQKAYPILSANSQRATSYIIPTVVGTNSYSNLSILNILSSVGWDIGSHTMNHIDLSTVPNSTITSELNNSYDYIYNNISTRSANFFSYPYDGYNSIVLPFVEARYVTARNSMSGLVQGHYENHDIEPYLFKGGSIHNTTTVASILDKINNTIAYNGTLGLQFHNIKDSDAINQTDYLTSDFQNISDYLASRSSDIDVVTFTDYVIKNVPNNTPLLNKTVTIYVNGSSFITIDNYEDDITVNASITPSSDSLTVNVTTWNTTGDYYKNFTESSTNATNTANHTIGDNPINTTMQINRDGAYYATVTTNGTGYFDWNYMGGYSNHTFEIFPSITFSNIAQTEPSIYQSSQANHISVQAASSNPITSVQAGITYLGYESNYSMTNASGTWSYDFKSGVPGTYSISHIYAYDNTSGTNSTTTGLSFVVVPTQSSGNSGSSGSTTPTATPTPTIGATPQPTSTQSTLIPVKLPDKITLPPANPKVASFVNAMGVQLSGLDTVIKSAFPPNPMTSSVSNQIATTSQWIDSYIATIFRSDNFFAGSSVEDIINKFTPSQWQIGAIIGAFILLLMFEKRNK